MANIKEGGFAQESFPLEKVTNYEIHGLVRELFVGQGITLRNFASIYLLGMTEDYVRLGILGQKGLPEPHLLDWGEIYRFIKRDNFLITVNHSDREGRRGKIVVDIPRNVIIVPAPDLSSKR